MRPTASAGRHNRPRLISGGRAMQESDETRAARFDRARLLRLGAAAAVPLVLGLDGADAAIRDDVFAGRKQRLAAREKRGEFAWWDTWGGGYHYVPHRIVTTAAALPQVQRVLSKRSRPIRSTPIKSAFDAVGAAELRVASDTPIPALLRKLFGESPPKARQLPVAPHYVLAGEPEYLGGPYGPPKHDDPEAPFAPAPPPGGPRVAVIDTGYHWGLHPDLDAHVPQTNAAQLPDVTPHDSILDDQAAHGLFISGIVVRGAPTAAIEIVKVLEGGGSGEGAAVAQAANRSRGRPAATVLNMSRGPFGDPQFPPIGLALALALLPPTTAVVAAAGNNHSNQPMYPAAFSRAIGVAAAADEKGTPAAFSNYGPWNDCYVPGANVHGAFDDWSGAVATIPQSNDTFKGWATWSGTSFAAPKLAGAIAAKVGPTVTAQQAADALIHDPALPILPDYGRFLNL